MTLVLLVLSCQHQPEIPTPEEYIGWKPGADYELSAYEDMVDYYRALSKASDRVRVEQIGESVEGRPIYLMLISSRQNLENLDRYREISRSLALADDLTNSEARSMAEEGKVFVWLNMGIDPEEVASAQTGLKLSHKLASDKGERVNSILDETVTLLVPQMGPDGHERVRDWYYQNLDTEYETAPRPQPYKRHPYMGSDTNRDFMFMHLPKTRAVAKGFWHDWHPQIIHDFHQTGPYPGRIFLPPFADPVNPNIPSKVVNAVNRIGTQISDQFAREGKPGAYSHVNYSMWWQGGLRLSPYYRNQIGILSETQLGEDSSDQVATPHYTDPDELPESFYRGVDLPADRPSVFYPDPWEGGWWHLSDAVDYQMSAAMATLESAANEREDWLLRRYELGRDAIEQGEKGHPYAYVIPTNQWDYPTAVDMVDVLRRGGLQVHQATSEFVAGSTAYPEGSYVLYAAQAFRPYLMDMMEPQNYPDRRQYPGGPPAHPYDLAGWTLPYQMGVHADRIDEAFEAEVREIEEVKVNRGELFGDGEHGFIWSGQKNFSWKVVNRLQREGAQIHRFGESVEINENHFEKGSFFVESEDGITEILQSMAEETGINFSGVDWRPAEAMQEFKIPEIGVYKSMVKHNDEGWTRFMLERFGFAYQSVTYENVLDGELENYDVMVFPSQYHEALVEGHDEGEVPEKYQGGLGRQGVEVLENWVRDGGRMVMLSGTVNFALKEFDLPVNNAVTGLPQDDFFLPSTLLRMSVDTNHPMGWGMPEETSMKVATTGPYATMVFDGTEHEEVRVVSSYPEDALLLSGWELGADQYLGGRPSAVHVGYGEGDFVLFGFPPQFRAGTAATFKMFFNAVGG